MRDAHAGIGSHLKHRMASRLAALLLAAGALSGCSGGQVSDPANSNWEWLGNSPEMQHHASLSTINTGNVDDLELAWSVEMPNVDGLVGNPLIKDGVIFQGGPSGTIFANDVRTGKLLWSYEDTADFSHTSLSGY